MLSVENMLKYSQGESLQRATEQRSKNVTRKADFKVKKPVDPVFYPRQIYLKYLPNLKVQAKNVQKKLLLTQIDK